MGLDIHIYRARNKEVLESGKWDEVKEVYYARKFWALIQEAKFIDIKRDECEFIQLTQANVNELLEIATHIPDFWGEFTTVPSLCSICYDFESIEDEGYHYYLEFDY